MTSHLSVTELARHFADYINQVAYRGEHYVITRGGKPVAELRPVSKTVTLGELPGLLTSLPRLTEEESSAFTADLDAARADLTRAGLGMPMPS